VITASIRSPMPSSTASAWLGATAGEPSVWVTRIETPGTPTRNAVSAAALMSRSRTRCPALLPKVLGAVEIRPLASM
jgi:hypothetical protein